MLRINSLGGVAVLAALVGFTSACTKTPEPEKPDCQEQPGIACIWAGATGALGFNGDGHDRRDTMLYWPIDMEFAPDGTPWILDWNNHLIRKLNGDQTFTTVVGSFLGDGAADGSDARSRERRCDASISAYVSPPAPSTGSNTGSHPKFVGPRAGTMRPGVRPAASRSGSRARAPAARRARATRAPCRRARRPPTAAR